MQDCCVELKAVDGRVTMHAQDVSLEDLCTFCGVFQVFAGKAALARGADLDTVKDKLLDIYLAAVNSLEGKGNV